MANDFWDENAEQWTKALEARAIASRAITNPAILHAVLEGKPRSVLDLGCGEGWMAPEFLSRQIQYQGYDGSLELIQIARKKHGPYFEYRRFEDLVSTDTTTESSTETSIEPTLDISPVDAIVLNYSVLTENVLPIFQSFKRFLNPKGAVFIQTLHPCYALKPYKDGWQSEDFKALQASAGHPVRFQGAMPWYGRTLSSWIKLISESGLQLQKMIEPLCGDAPVSLIFVLGLPS